MAGFDVSLAPAVTRVALCWRVLRADGAALGFTTHDRALTIDGMRYEAAPGIAPSAVETSDGLAVETLDVAGAIGGDAITERDLDAGRYDGASARLFMADWTDPDGATLPLARGTLGEIERRTTDGTGSFSAGLRGPAAAFEAVAVESCSPECRAELGDRRCRIDLAARTVQTTATGDAEGRVTPALAGGLERFAHGRCRALDGANAGLDARVAGIEAGALVLLEPLPFALAAGTAVELREGCDKRLATCAGRFGNAANFRGEPHVPGSDVLTRFYLG